MGAGTGATSVSIFKMLEDTGLAVEEYCYTDISSAFIRRARETFSAGPDYLRYAILNIEQSAELQSIPTGEYDVIIAANVLHATNNIRASLANVKALVRENGILLLNEISSSFVFTHLTFGLLDGWWRYEDGAVRLPGCPGVSPDVWRHVLIGEGFREVFFPAEKAHRFGQQIIVCESDGLVKHSQTLSA